MSNALEFGKWLSHPAQGEEVVITGISGRFPESNNVQEFEENLFNEIDTVTKDARRWKLKHPEVPERNGKIYNIDKLDAGYFGLHHRQADIMDPLIRKFLECALEAVIDAGVNPSQLEGSRTAVLNIEETISAQETYHIIGYSFGSCVAVELTKLLEARGFTGFLIIIDGSPAYTAAIARQTMPRNDENEFQTIVFLKILSLFLPAEHLLNEKDKFSECKTFDQHFQKAKSLMLSEFVEEEDLLKRAMMGVYRRCKSMLDYKSDGVKIKYPVHLFKASVPWISDIAEDYELYEVCEQPVEFTVVNGDHSTILNQEQLANNINKLFKL